jgi:hypothetical protein
MPPNQLNIFVLLFHFNSKITSLNFTKKLTITNSGKFADLITVLIFFFVYSKKRRSSLWQSQKIVLGNAISNSLLFFIQLAAFGYGARLVVNQEMTYVQVFQ